MNNYLSREKYLGNNPKELDSSKIGGSIIAIITTDLPLNARQLNRLSRRGAFGIVNTGSRLTH